MENFFINGIALFIIVGSVSLVFKDFLKRETINLMGLFEGGNFTDFDCIEQISPKEITFIVDVLKMFGELFEANNVQEPPFIVLLHLSSVCGRKLTLIRVLAIKFQDLSYSVLAIDSRC